MSHALKALPFVAALAAGAALSGPPAEAQVQIPNRMTAICTFAAYCAYDTSGHILGVYQQQNLLTRQIGQKAYNVGYNAFGFEVNTWFYYASQNCTGQPLIASGYEDNGPLPFDPVFALWDGANFWGPTGLLSTMTVQSAGTGQPGNCQSSAPYTSAFATAAVIETPKIGAPTAACEAAQNCVTVK